MSSPSGTVDGSIEKLPSPPSLPALPPGLAVPLDRAAYEGREQTFAKHFFLRRYLYALAFKLLQADPDRELRYVDAFSGPWRSAKESHADTSFGIALGVLTDVAERLRQQGQDPRISATFVEKGTRAFKELSEAVSGYTAVRSNVFHGRFEDRLPDVVQGVGDAFVFAFVDPRGWTGMPLHGLKSLLKGRRREVMVNLMSYAVQRHVPDQRERIRGSFDALFGDTAWWAEYEALRAECGGDGEEAFRLLYLRRLRATCGFKWVTTTRIRWPGKDRTYFHLAYGTNHPAGIEVFREAEKRCVDEQEGIARSLLRQKASKASGMDDLFGGLEDRNEVAFREDRASALRSVEASFGAWLRGGNPARRSHLFAELMQQPLIYKADLVGFVTRAQHDGRLTVHQGLGSVGTILTPVPTGP